MLLWYNQYGRDLPWRSSLDPYQVWISEIMLQQTRVEQALPYFERFLDRFPTLQALAAAGQDDVLLCWEGLGYYARARNMQRAAQVIVRDHGGVFPDTPAGLKALPGIGDYTAAAILSIVYEKPFAVLDGNVVRVLARLLGFSEDVRKAASRRFLQDAADHLLDRSQPSRFNQAMMELGATICTPRNPSCETCPLKDSCIARRTEQQHRLPFAAKKKAVPHYDIAVGLVWNPDGQLLISRRPEEGLLGGLWEFPGGKRDNDEPLEETCRRELREELCIDVHVGSLFHRLTHAYSHFRITLHAYSCTLWKGEPRSSAGLPVRWVPPAELDDYAFPRANRRLIEKLLKEPVFDSAVDGI